MFIHTSMKINLDLQKQSKSIENWVLRAPLMTEQIPHTKAKL